MALTIVRRVRSAIELLAAAVEAPLTWRDFAQCLGADPELFFPERGQDHKSARAMCKACAVTGECLDYAIENGIKAGIWGGRSERERRKVNRERQQEMVTASAVSLAS